MDYYTANKLIIILIILAHEKMYKNNLNCKIGEFKMPWIYLLKMCEMYVYFEKNNLVCRKCLELLLFFLFFFFFGKVVEIH